MDKTFAWTLRPLTSQDVRISGATKQVMLNGETPYDRRTAVEVKRQLGRVLDLESVTVETVAAKEAQRRKHTPSVRRWTFGSTIGTYDSHREKAGYILWFDVVARHCATVEPEGKYHASNVKREIWETHRELVFQLRLFEFLGVLPAGKYEWMQHVLSGDLEGAIRRYAELRNYPLKAVMMNLPDEVQACLHYLWSGMTYEGKPNRAWGSESRMKRTCREGGRFGYYIYPGLSSPVYMIFDCVKAMRRY